MKLNDVSTIVNELRKEMTGAEALEAITTADVVELGKTLSELGVQAEPLYQKIADKVGRVVIKNKLYKGKMPNILVDGWSYGSIMETLRVKTFEATTDPSRNPVNGTEYNQDVYESADIVAKYYNKGVDFQIEYWRPTDQLWSAFDSLESMTRFLGAIETAVATSMNVKVLALAKTAVNNMIAQTVDAEFPSGITTTSTGVKVINLLKLYNDKNGTSLTKQACRQNADFLKFAVKTILNTRDRLLDISTMFNIDGEEVFSNADDLNLTMLSTFANDVKVNMQSDVYHNELVSLPNYDDVPYWQGSGTGYTDADIEKIMCVIEKGDSTKSVTVNGVVGVLFDKNGVAVTCEHRKTTTHYNANIDQTHFYDKYYAQYLNDFSENFVVFIIDGADTTQSSGGVSF